jgi:hypothetical protein
MSVNDFIMNLQYKKKTTNMKKITRQKRLILIK